MDIKNFNLIDIEQKLDKFIILNPQEIYLGIDSKIEVECKKCGSKYNKLINNLVTSCRTCSNNERYIEIEKNKLEKLKESFPEILSWKKHGQDYNIAFICNTCNKDSLKTFSKYEKIPICTSCSTSISSKKREKKRGDKHKRLTDKLNLLNEDFYIKEYKNSNDNIIIKCKSCGNIQHDKVYRVLTFERQNKNYLCRNCSLDNKLRLSAYNMVKFYENSDLGNNIGYLYMYEVVMNDKKFFKLGITRNSILSRIRKISKIYEIKNIVFIADTNLNVAKLERSLKKKYQNYKIKPDKKFEGYTECFTIPILFEEKMEVQRLSHDGSTSQAYGDGSEQPL